MCSISLLTWGTPPIGFHFNKTRNATQFCFCYYKVKREDKLCGSQKASLCARGIVPVPLRNLRILYVFFILERADERRREHEGPLTIFWRQLFMRKFQEVGFELLFCCNMGLWFNNTTPTIQASKESRFCSLSILRLQCFSYITDSFPLMNGSYFSTGWYQLTYPQSMDGLHETAFSVFWNAIYWAQFKPSECLP